MGLSRDYDESGCLVFRIETPAETVVVRRCGANQASADFYDPSDTIKPPPFKKREPRNAVATPQQAGPSMWEKAREFQAAMASGVSHGAVPLPVLNFRVACCFGHTLDGRRVSAPCPYKDPDDFCNDCGCGKRNELASLVGVVPGDYRTSKLAWPDLKCPRDRFTEYTADGTQPPSASRAFMLLVIIMGAAKTAAVQIWRLLRWQHTDGSARSTPPSAPGEIGTAAQHPQRATPSISPAGTPTL